MRLKLQIIKPGVSSYLVILIGSLFFAVGLPLFFLFKPSSYLFEIGGVVLVVAILALVSGLSEIAN